MLKKGKGEQRIAKIYDRYYVCCLVILFYILYELIIYSPLMPENEATFQITNGGIDDVA